MQFQSVVHALNFILAWDRSSVFELKDAIEVIRTSMQPHFAQYIPTLLEQLRRDHGNEKYLAVDKLGGTLSGEPHCLLVTSSQPDPLASDTAEMSA